MPPVRMCIEFETAGEIPGEKSMLFDYAVVESVSLLEGGLFIMVGGTLSTAPKRDPVSSWEVSYQIVCGPFFRV